MRHGRAITFESHSPAPEGPRKLAGGKPGAAPGYGPINPRALTGRRMPVGPPNTTFPNPDGIPPSSPASLCRPGPLTRRRPTWHLSIVVRLTAIPLLPEGFAMILRSPPGMKGPCPCRPGALTRRCERPGASIISSPQGIFTVEDRGEGKALKRTTGSLKSPTSPFPNPNGIPPFSPGLSRQRDYPGKRDPLSFQPQRGCGPDRGRAKSHNPIGGRAPA